MTRTLLTVGAILLVGGCGAPEPIEAVREVPRNVRVLDLGPVEIDEFYEVAGPVSPVRAADLAAQETGPVTALGAAKGSRVEPGAVIVEQERDILKAEMAAAEAALATQDYNVDKVRQLHAAGKVSRIELLNAETAYAQAQSAADVARVRWERAAVAAPFAGVVVDRFVELGEMLAPGMPVARVIDPYTLKLTAFLTDAQVRWVAAGDAAEVRLGGSTGTVPAQVAFVSPEADLKTGKFAVEIEIPNPDLAWQSGVIGRARLPKHRTEGAIAVPRDAVLPDRAGDSVFVVEGERARRRSVRLGAYQGLMVVVEDGLVAGERIVVRGQRDLRDGSLVTVTEVAAAADGSIAGDPQAASARGAATRIGGAAEASR